MRVRPPKPSGSEDDYRRVCAKALQLKETSFWSEINNLRDSILNTFQAGLERSRHTNEGEFKRYQKLEAERLRGIRELGLDLNSAKPEVDQLSELTEFARYDEGKRREFAQMFKLDDSATWETIHTVYQHLKQACEERFETASEVRSKLCEAVKIPEHAYVTLESDIQMGLDIGAHYYLQEKKDSTTIYL